MTEHSLKQDAVWGRYEPRQYEPPSGSRYDRWLVALRHSLIRDQGGERDVLDLACGTGAYLLPNLPQFRSAVGVDLSVKMLDVLRERVEPSLSSRVRLACADARELPLPDASRDLVYSYSALYAIPDVDRVLAEIARVLRPGGTAVLELGTRPSLHAWIWSRHAASTGWARHHVRTLDQTRQMVERAGFEVVGWRSLQLLPLSGVTHGLRFLYPLATPAWKHVLALSIRGRIVDEWLSRGFLRKWAFRHFVTVRKR